MPNNRMGDEPKIDLPRQPIAHDPEFGVQRMLDGHIVPEDGVQDYESRNVHKP